MSDRGAPSISARQASLEPPPTPPRWARPSAPPLPSALPALSLARPSFPSFGAIAAAASPAYSSRGSSRCEPPRPGLSVRALRCGWAPRLRPASAAPRCCACVCFAAATLISRQVQGNRLRQCELGGCGARCAVDGERPLLDADSADGQLPAASCQRLPPGTASWTASGQHRKKAKLCTAAAAAAAAAAPKKNPRRCRSARSMLLPPP